MDEANTGCEIPPTLVMGRFGFASLSVHQRPRVSHEGVSLQRPGQHHIFILLNAGNEAADLELRGQVGMDQQ
jgi:hypothetical protein